MPKISGLPPITAIAADDELPINDTSATTTKKITLSQVLQQVYPVGSVYINASVSTNPATLLGFGTWVAHATGRVQVGIDASQTEFDTLGETGGAKTHTLTVAEMPSHSHGQNVTANTGPALRRDFVSEPGGSNYAQGTNTYSEGGGGAHNNLQPYIVVYMWRRTA